ncbi:MAG: GNAT family N-acetyltransferase [Cryomorphaceae bacterium]|nr:MAG: GNAT family N-acetyltransferase [Cryomorphaceae bacterium]
MDAKLWVCGTNDRSRIESLAFRIWKPAFRDILPPDRLDYLFEWMYAPEKLEQQLADNDTRFYLLLHNGQDIGYAQLLFLDDHTKLEKLYVDQAFRKRKLGLWFLNALVGEVRARGFNVIRLQVNRANITAIDFYRKFGFTTIASKDFDVGEGHVMDDFVMEWRANQN